VLAGAGCGDQRHAGTERRKLIILGVDGMDAKLTRLYLDEGRLPNLARLARSGSFLPLATVDPPQSPVAWSSFITGLDSTGHGIFDFVHRDPSGPEPYLSTSRTREPRELAVGDLVLPLGAPEITLLRHGPAFWQVLESYGVPASVIKIPANFPPAPSQRNVSTSDMGTPDLLGTYGTFQVITSDPRIDQGSMKGGLVHRALRSGANEYKSALTGPPSPFSRHKKPLELPVEVHVDAAARTLVVTLGETPVVLREGEWSSWTPVAFDPGFFAKDARGIVRIYAKTLVPELMLYVSPVNVDPLAPIVPLSSPPGYASQQARAVGRFFTQGLAEDTKALAAGALSDEEFVAQSLLVFDERKKLLEQALDEYQGGLLFFYVSSLDLISHMFWRALEPDAKADDARYANVIPDMYERVDALVGRVLERAGPDATVVVMSDHGFTSYRYKVNLNTWLAQNGYLSRRPGPQAGQPMAQIDWENTQAYALGLNQIFINQAGREAKGIVPLAERAALIVRLRRELEAWRHDETGVQVVTQTAAPDAGDFSDRAPDLLVGFNAGYRNSDESALCELSERSIERNLGKWSGDHCIDPRHVPGVLVSSRPVARPDVSLLDFAPTILRYFGIEPSPGVRGRSFFKP
jgi:predicted AlkP superfamily phosphohydrolase/phosphomutase